MKKTVWLAGAIAAVGIAAAAYVAPATLAADAQVIDRMTPANVTGILQEWGATNIKSGETEPVKWADGTSRPLKYLTFEHSGVTYVAYFHACDESGCRGLQVALGFEGVPPALSVFNDFNRGAPAGKAYTEEKGYVSERYIIVDDGVSRGNILMQFKVLEGITGRMLQFMKDRSVVAALPDSSRTQLSVQMSAPSVDGSSGHVTALQRRPAAAYNKPPQ